MYFCEWEKGSQIVHLCLQGRRVIKIRNILFEIDNTLSLK